MRILNLVGENINATLQQVYESPEIHMEPDGEGYNVVMVHNALSSKPVAEAGETLKTLAGYVLPHGELYMSERSAEWFAEAVIGRTVDQVSLSHVYGTDEKPIRSLYTIPMLRQLLTDHGFQVFGAEAVSYLLARFSNGVEAYAKSNYISATKVWDEKTLWKD